MKPLDGIVVADFSRVLAGPMATQILADLGARVIKIENPYGGDESRSWEPRLVRDSAYFFAFNRGKQSVTLDLKTETGKSAARDIALRSDILIENFPVGQMAKFGLGYSDLAPLNARLIYVSNTGFGQNGPYSGKIGYDTVFQALGGLMSLTGERGRGPVKAGLPMADLTSGLWIAISALTGLAGRAASGKGCSVDVSMMDVQVSLLTIAAARYFALGQSPEREGTEHPGRVPSAAFACSDGKWVQVSASDQHWIPLCEALGLSDLAADESLRTNAARLGKREEIYARLTAGFRALPQQDVVTALEQRKVPVGAINTVEEILADPHTSARGMVGQFDYPDVGSFPALRNPLLMAGYDNPEIAPPPVLGQHTADVLREFLGYDEDQVAALSATAGSGAAR